MSVCFLNFSKKLISVMSVGLHITPSQHSSCVIRFKASRAETPAEVEQISSQLRQSFVSYLLYLPVKSVDLFISLKNQKKARTMSKNVLLSRTMGRMVIFVRSGNIQSWVFCKINKLERHLECRVNSDKDSRECFNIFSWLRKRKNSRAKYVWL